MLDMNEVILKNNNYYCKRCGKPVNARSDGFVHRSKSETASCYNKLRLGKKQSPELIEKRIAPLRGRKQSKENIEKRMLKIRGRKNPKISARLIGNSNGKGGKGKKKSMESRKKMSISKSGKPSKLKGKHYKIPEPNTPIDYIKYPKELICPKCRNKLFLNIKISVRNDKYHKKGDVIRLFYSHETKELDKICFKKGVSLDEINIYLKLSKILNKNKDFFWNPHKIYAVKDDTKFKYPGIPDFVIPKYRMIIEYQGRGGHHGDHPIDINNKNDLKELKRLKENPKNSFEKCLAYVWGYKDPLKRQWCKDNDVKLVELWNQDDVDEFVKEINEKLQNKC